MRAGSYFASQNIRDRAVARSSARRTKPLVSKLPSALLAHSDPARRNAQVAPAGRRLQAYEEI